MNPLVPFYGQSPAKFGSCSLIELSRLPAIRKFRDPKPTCRYRSAKFLEAHFLLATLRVADDTSEEVGTLESKLPGETIPWVPANELLTANDRSDVETGDASRCGSNTCSSYKGET